MRRLLKISLSFEIHKFCWIVSILLSLVSSVGFAPQATTQKQVYQKALVLMCTFTDSGAYNATHRYPWFWLANLRYPVDKLNVETTQITNSTLYDGNVGKYSAIFIDGYYDVLTPRSINSAEWGLLSAYEKNFGVVEVVYGDYDFTSNTAVEQRYGIASHRTYQGLSITRTRWVNNGIVETVDFKGVSVTLASGSTVYSYMGNSTDGQPYPYLWSYTDSEGVTRVTCLANCGGGGYLGDVEAYTLPVMLGAKLSSANELFKYYFSMDIDDINLPPDGSDYHMDGDDVAYVYNNLIVPYGVIPTLHIFVGSISVYRDFPTMEASFYNSVLQYKDYHDFAIHPNIAAVSETYSENQALLHLANLTEWNIAATSLYFIPDGHLYNNNSVKGLQDVGYEFVAQMHSTTSNKNPYCKYPEYQAYATEILRIPRLGFRGLAYNTRNMTKSFSGDPDSGTFWRKFFHGALYSPFPKIGYYITMTHEANWLDEDQSGDTAANSYPAMNETKALFTINILPIVSVPSTILAWHIRTLQDYNITARYNIDAQTITYSIVKRHAGKDDYIALILPPNSSTDVTPSQVRQTNFMTAVILKQQSSITAYIGTSYSEPYITYSTGDIYTPIFENSKLTFTVSAPSGATSIAKVYVGDKGEPTGVSANNGILTWNYNASTKIITLKVTHAGTGPANVLVDWRISGDVNSDNKVDAYDLFDLSKAYGSDTPKPNWNPDCDFNWDGEINSSDLLTLSKGYGIINT